MRILKNPARGPPGINTAGTLQSVRCVKICGQYSPVHSETKQPTLKRRLVAVQFRELISMSDSILSFSDSSSNGEQAKPSSAGDRPKKRPKSPRGKAPPQVQAAVPEVVTPEHRPLSSANDPFAPDNLLRMRLSQDFTALVEVRPSITSVAVRKPLRQEFVRVRPGAEWRYQTGCFVDNDTREVYMVTPELWPAMPGDVTPTALVVAMSRNSPVPFLWPLVLPSSDGRPNRWHESGIEAARLAESQWLRFVADMAARCYVPFVAAAKLSEPEWPADLTMNDLLRLAFQGRFIRDMSHPCLQRLRGAI